MSIILLLLSQTWSSAQAQEIGKLFSTPEEREYLDYLRSEFLLNSQETGFNIDRTVTPEIPVVEEAPEPEPLVIEYSLGGIMNRRDGSRTVWLNNQPVNESDLPPNFSLQMQNGALNLRIEEAQGVFFLQPGQRVNLATGVVSESFQDRRPDEAPGIPLNQQPDSQNAGNDIPQELNESGSVSAEDTLNETLQQVQDVLELNDAQ